MLAAATDNNSVRGYIEKNKCINALFDITLDVIETKMQTRIYQKRGKTLLNYWNKEAIPNSIELVNCACNVASLANFSFKSTPSFQEIATCSGGCPPRMKSLPSITITDREMKEPLGQILKNHVVLPDVQCQNENCEMMEQNQIHTLSDIVLIAVDMDDSIDSASIPKKIACPKTEEMYDLLGFVDYQGQNIKTRRSTPLGHYTAVCKRKLNWIIYDDLKAKSIRIEEGHQVHPELLIYSKP
ncbi:hypothetical protein JTB14_024218 [Gonioctena quinquepunctata]|nr:hypothetical protein JTB14_024218 [Gonioctena quinquepunctata]